MKNLLFFTCLALFLLTACGTDAPGLEGETGGVPAGYELVFNDEFDSGTLPDREKWGYQTGGYGWVAKELQNYQEADPDNVAVADGKLKITARAEKVGRNPYTSTRLVTNDIVELAEGYYEVRAKFPAGAGLRSSFWMVGGNVSKDGWPLAGEIDLVEHYGRVPDRVGAAIQTMNNTFGNNNQLGKTIRLADCTENFHTYSCHWTAEQLEFAVDGKVYWTYENDGKGRESYPFTEPFYMAATLAVGGLRGPKGPVDDSALPATLEIDYVRVYQPED